MFKDLETFSSSYSQSHNKKLSSNPILLKNGYMKLKISLKMKREKQAVINTCWKTKGKKMILREDLLTLWTDWFMISKYIKFNDLL